MFFVIMIKKRRAYLSTDRYSVVAPASHHHLNANSLFISHAVYESDWVSVLHTHPFTEVFYVINGRGSFLTNKKKFAVKKNDIIIVNPNIEHTEASSTDDPLEYIAIGMSHISFTNKKGSPTKRPFLFANFQDKQDDILFYLQAIMLEAKEQTFNYEHICHHLANVLVYKLQRKLNVQVKIEAPSKIGKEVAIAKEYINHNFKERITLDTLANIVHLNKFYLSRIFKTTVGQTPIEFLNERRMEEACVLLKTTDLTISEIASMIGFSSQSYFSELFLKHRNKTPTNYRKQFK